MIWLKKCKIKIKLKKNLIKKDKTKKNLEIYKIFYFNKIDYLQLDGFMVLIKEQWHQFFCKVMALIK